ncbi:AhpD-like protein [Aspergillus floccosus]
MSSPAAQDSYRKRCLVPYPNLEDLPPVVHDKLQILPFRRNILFTIARSHGLAPHLLGLIGACFDGSQRKLPTLDWQLIVLRTATVLGAQYEWDVNLPVAEVYEMPQEKIDNIDCPAEDILDSAKGPWTDRNRVLLRLVDEQLATYSNEAKTVMDAVQMLGPDLVVEALIVIGLYALLARLLKGLRVDEDPEIPDLKEKIKGAITATK